MQCGDARSGVQKPKKELLTKKQKEIHEVLKQNHPGLRPREGRTPPFPSECARPTRGLDQWTKPDGKLEVSSD